MINKFVLISITAFLMLASCKKDRKTPACIDSKVNEYKFTISCSVGGSVKEYEFQSKRVYVFDPGTCGADMTSQVLDENCNSLGYLGGIMGNTKINGEEFDHAKYKSTVWSQ